MAIAFDAVSSTSVSGGTNPMTWSHTCSGANRILIVSVVRQNSGATVSSITYDGVAMTLLGSSSYHADTTQKQFSYYLAAPASGSNTVSVTFSTSSGIACGTSVSYTGAKQTSVPDSFNSFDRTNTGTLSLATTVVDTGCWLYSAALSYNTIYTDNGVSGSLAVKRAGFTDLNMCGDSNGTVATGSQTATWTNGVNQNLNSMLVLSLAPAPLVATGGFFLAAA